MLQMTPPEPGTLAPSLKNPINSVVSALSDQIQSGNYKAGDWLPSERSLAEGLGVDRRVIRTAIQQLVQSGLIVRRPHCRPIIGQIGGEAPQNAPVESETPAPYSNIIALLMWHGDDRFERTFTTQQRVFWGMNQALADAGYHAVYVELGGRITSDTDNAKHEAEHLRYIVQRGFGGAIFYPYAYRYNRELVEEVRRKIPLVTIDREVDGVDTDFVGVDNFQSIYDTVMHLIEKGHRRIAYITKNEQIRPVQDRLMGYIHAMRDASLNELVLCIPADGLLQPWTSIDAVFRLPKGERPTAAVVFNDYSAVDLMIPLANAGLTVPGDVAVTGFDDIAQTLPNGVGLTSIAQPYEGIGRKAVEVLLNRIQNPHGPRQVVALPAQLIVRESSRGPFS
ncbi:MAG: transcriptional regulator, LacI family [Capsulimonas sp.]|jgi:DNA-binding LacI/PurR family transcriptional regulator|nr:transcriptional regulator, LacI family [Capsulimonas sp.]